MKPVILTERIHQEGDPMSVSRTLFFLAGLALARIAEAGTLYAVDGDNDNIYSLD